jgi:hypothetical protein
MSINGERGFTHSIMILTNFRAVNWYIPYSTDRKKGEGHGSLVRLKD